MPSGVSHVSPLTSAAMDEPAGSVNAMVRKSGIWVMARSIVQGRPLNSHRQYYYRVQRTECHAPLMGLSPGRRWLLDADRIAFARVAAFPVGPNPRLPKTGNPTDTMAKTMRKAASRKIATTSPRRRACHFAMSMSTKPIGTTLCQIGHCPTATHGVGGLCPPPSYAFYVRAIPGVCRLTHPCCGGW